MVRYTMVANDIPYFFGGLAQLGERLLCKQNVVGSILTFSIANILKSASRRLHGTRHVHDVNSSSESFWMSVEQGRIVGNQGCQLLRLTQSKYKTKTKFYM